MCGQGGWSGAGGWAPYRIYATSGSLVGYIYMCANLEGYNYDISVVLFKALGKIGQHLEPNWKEHLDNKR